MRQVSRIVVPSMIMKTRVEISPYSNPLLTTLELPVVESVGPPVVLPLVLLGVLGPSVVLLVLVVPGVGVVGPLVVLVVLGPSVVLSSVGKNSLVWLGPAPCTALVWLRVWFPDTLKFVPDCLGHAQLMWKES